MFAIASSRTCVAMETSDGVFEAAEEEAGGNDNTIDPMLDCTISVYAICQRYHPWRTGTLTQPTAIAINAKKTQKCGSFSRSLRDKSSGS